MWQPASYSKSECRFVAETQTLECLVSLAKRFHFVSAGNRGDFGGLLPTERSYKPQRVRNLEQLSVHAKFILAEFSNTTGVGKILNFNQVCDHVTLLPSLSSILFMRS